MTNSRAKGVKGELEVSALLRSYQFEARRGQQFSGLGNSPDVVHSIEGYHIEVKYMATYKLHAVSGKEVSDWTQQAFRDAKGKIPVIFHRGARGEWFVITFGEVPDQSTRYIQTAHQFLARKRSEYDDRRNHLKQPA